MQTWTAWPSQSHQWEGQEVGWKSAGCGFYRVYMCCLPAQLHEPVGKFSGCNTQVPSEWLRRLLLKWEMSRSETCTTTSHQVFCYDSEIEGNEVTNELHFSLLLFHAGFQTPPEILSRNRPCCFLCGGSDCGEGWGSWSSGWARVASNGTCGPPGLWCDGQCT